jgi:hypothetical protein
MAVRERGLCAYCQNKRRKPLPLGLVKGLPEQMADLLVCRPCRKFIHGHFETSLVIRKRLELHEALAFLASSGARPE